MNLKKGGLIIEDKYKNARSKASAKYAKANVKRYILAFNKKTDAELISYLDSLNNKQGYIKELIRKDLEK